MRALESVRLHAHDQIVAAARGEVEQPQMAGMEDVEVARNENDALTSAACGVDSSDDTLSVAHQCAGRVAFPQYFAASFDLLCILSAAGSREQVGDHAVY